MNLFQLLLKQICQRALSSTLTVLSIALGVGLAIAILVLDRESESLFGQTDYGYEVLAGVKGPDLQLALNTIYRIGKSPGNVKYSVYENLLTNPLFTHDVRLAIPQCVGDSYRGRPIVGTVPQFFGYDDDGRRVENEPGQTPRRFEYRPGKSFEIAQGQPFKQNRFEAVIGSDITKATGLKLGDDFQATHGFPKSGETPDVHSEHWKVVGVLAPTHTAADGCVYIGLTSFYTIFEHAKAELDFAAIRKGETAPSLKPATKDDDDVKHYMVAPNGTILLDKDVLAARELSAILIKAKGEGGANVLNLVQNLNLQPDVMAINPATTMREFFSTFIAGPTLLLLVIAGLVIVVASVGVLTTIYNSVAARTHEIAVLRALGATRNRILLLVTAEATILGVVGAILGLLLGHAMAAGGGVLIASKLGESINWAKISPMELVWLAAVAVLAFFAGLVPALKAYRTPVATNLAG